MLLSSGKDHITPLLNISMSCSPPPTAQTSHFSIGLLSPKACLACVTPCLSPSVAPSICSSSDTPGLPLPQGLYTWCFLSSARTPFARPQPESPHPRRCWIAPCHHSWAPPCPVTSGYSSVPSHPYCDHSEGGDCVQITSVSTVPTLGPGTTKEVLWNS